MLYNVVSFLARLFLNGRVEIIGKENIPADGSAILICNHRCANDPIALATATRRTIHYLAKKELFNKKFFAWFLGKFHAIPIDRDGSDRAALRRCITVLKDGGILGVFPEGTRSKTGELLPFKSGTSFIAAQTGASFIPAAIEGSQRIFNPFAPKARLVIGFPIPYLPLEGEKKRETMDRMTEVQQEAVRNLLQQINE